MDSFFQAFATAPLFVWYELLFRLGYRPQLRREVEADILVKLTALRAEQEANALLGGAREPMLASR